MLQLLLLSHAVLWQRLLRIESQRFSYLRKSVSLFRTNQGICLYSPPKKSMLR